MTEIFGIDVAGIVAAEVGPGLPAVTLRRYTTQQADTLTGAPVVTSKDYSGRGGEVSFSSQELQDSKVLTDDVKFLVLGGTLAVTPKPKDVFILPDGRALEALRILSRDMAQAAYSLHCRPTNIIENSPEDDDPITSLVQLLSSTAGAGVYEPWDTTSLYQGVDGSGGNADGYTDPVGVMLDKAQMGGKTAAAFIAGQPEMAVLTSMDSNWTNNGDGSFTADGSSNGNVKLDLTAFSEGDIVAVSFEITAYTSGFVGPSRGFTVVPKVSAVNQYSWIVPITALNGPSDGWIQSLAFAGTIDNISIKELPGYHMIAPSASARPQYRTEVSRKQFDGVDDEMGTSFTAGTLTSDMTVFIALKTTDTKFIPISGDGSVKHLVVADSGNAGSALESNAGSPSYLLNGVVQSWANRIAAHAALATGNWCILEIVGADLSTWTQFKVSGYSGFHLAGDVGSVLFAPSPSASERTAIRNFMANRYGVTL